jgi:hypothetical protein
MASGMSNVSRSSAVGRDARQARNSRRSAELRFGVVVFLEHADWEIGAPLRRPFDEGDFLGRKIVEFIDQLINFSKDPNVASLGIVSGFC